MASWVGKQILDKTFFSTSVDLEGRYNPVFKDGQPVVRMFIHTPEGTGDLSLQGFSMHQSEHEILLPRNTRLHVDKITPFHKEQSSLQYLPDYVVHASLVHGDTMPGAMWPATSSSYTHFEAQSIQNIQHQSYQEVPQQQVDTGAAQKEAEWNAKNQGRLFVHRVSGRLYLVTTMSDYQRTMGADGTDITNYKEITRGPDRERLKNQWQRQLSMPIPDTYRQLLNTVLDTIAQREQEGR